MVKNTFVFHFCHQNFLCFLLGELYFIFLPIEILKPLDVALTDIFIFFASMLDGMSDGNFNRTLPRLSFGWLSA